MDKKLKHVRELKSQKEYVNTNNIFNITKNEYLYKLSNRSEHLEPDFPGILDIIFDPKDDMEIRYCESMFRIYDDISKIKTCCETGDIKRIDLNNCYSIKNISECIKLMEVDKVPKILHGKICSIDPARIMYELLVINGCDRDNFINKLIIESGYDPDDVDSVELFNFLYSLFFAFLNSVDTTKIMNLNNLDDILKFEINYSNRFHLMYLNGLNYNCSLGETYRENIFQKSLK